MSDLILAVDTTHEFGSLALIDAGETMEEVLLHSAEGFGHILYDHLQALLERSGIALERIGCFAAAAGPGSFTGVRIGLACVKGLAEATGRPVAAVSNLEAMAQFGSAPLRAPFLDARRGEIYGGLYDAEGSAPAPETVMPFGAWIERLPDRHLEFVALDFAPFFASLGSSRLAHVPRTTAPRALAAAVGRIAWHRWRADSVSDPAEVDANYVRRSDAELLRKDRF